MDEEHDDRRVARRSNDECRRIAQDTKTYFGIGRTWPVYIGRVVRSKKIRTLQGVRPLHYNVVENHELGIADAKTELVNGIVVITAKRAIDEQASFGEGRARMTLAHELGHAVMHATEGATDLRVAGASGATTVSKANAAESAEHQAKVFASAFLIDDTRAAELGSPLEIAEEFLVSLSAADICYERMVSERVRAAAAERVRESNRKFQALMKESQQPKRNYLPALCPGCRFPTLIPLGIKALCESCGYLGDHPEDN
jgi:hypothetical protein